MTRRFGARGAEGAGSGSEAESAASPPSARRRSSIVVFALALAYAPYQCGKSPERALREETPGEALYGLAQRMKAQGDDAGYRTTLRYIVERYPSSRYAMSARTDLGADDGGAPDVRSPLMGGEAPEASAP